MSFFKIRPLMDAEEASMTPPPAYAPTSATVVGRLVVMLDRSYGNYAARKATLEAEIAERQEELRQVNTAMASIGAALMATADDPVLTDDERAKAGAPLDKATLPADWAEGVDLDSMTSRPGVIHTGEVARYAV